MPSARKKTPELMTAEVFDAWVETGAAKGRRWQLVDGELRAMAPANATHGTIQGTLCHLIAGHLDATGSRCRVVAEPAIAVRIRARDNRRVPDLAVTCTPDRQGDVALPDPLLLVEILSPSNAALTWDNVRAYTTIPSVREIVILQSARIEAEVLRRQEDGTWPADADVVAAGAKLRLPSIGLDLPLDAVYAKTYLVP
jgi:Uma2 family endonuclease